MKKFEIINKQANAIKDFFVKMVAIETKELTYEQKLELVFYHYNGKSYHRLLNINEYLKSADIYSCRNLGKAT